MSTQTLLPASARTPATALRSPRTRRVLLLVALAIVAISAVRIITGATDLTSTGAVSAALAAAVPIGLAGLGGLWSERAGVVNIGLEGMMILGTFGGAWGALTFGAWGGILAGAVFGALGGLLHALATVTFNVDHIVSGVAITLLATGLARYLATFAFSDIGGGPTQSPVVPSLPRWSVPGLGWLEGIEQNRWFVVSDIAGIVRGALTELSALTVLAVILVVVTYLVLWRTAFGLRLRSCGENPKAAESLGVNVYLYKYYGVVISGALAGLGGAFLSIVAASIFREGQTAGRGYIGLATMIFGNWRPGGLASGALLFGYTDALQLRRGSESVHALLLFIAAVLVVIALLQLRRGHRVVAIVSAALAGGSLLWYFSTNEIPVEFVRAMPYVITLVVLALAAQRLRMPAADGLPYRKGEG
jgi:simple sugar transport system permease protein